MKSPREFEKDINFLVEKAKENDEFLHAYIEGIVQNYYEMWERYQNAKIIFLNKGFLVNLKAPDGVGIKEIEAYIENALKVYKGSLHPEDLMFNLDRETIRIQNIEDLEK